MERSGGQKKRNFSLDSDGSRTDEESVMSTDDYGSPLHSPSKEDSTDGEGSLNGLYAEVKLKFSVENILRPDFGCKAHSALGEEVIKSCALKSRTLHQNISNGSGQRPKSIPGLLNQAELQMQGLPPVLWPAWVYCTRYSDRPSAGPRSRRTKRKANGSEKRPRTAFTSQQLDRLRCEFQENRYLTEKRRQEIAVELGLNESQIKIWFQNKRAKMKKQNRSSSGLPIQLIAQGFYNGTPVCPSHSAISASNIEEEMSDLEVET